MASNRDNCERTTSEYRMTPQVNLERRGTLDFFGNARARTMNLVCIISFVLVALLGMAAAQEPTGQSESNRSDSVPRSLEVLDVGYKLPIEIVAVRNLQRRSRWVRDLEIEIKNVSAKPIYEVYLLLSMPDDKGPSGAPKAVSLEYGRPYLVHPRQRPSEDDKPFGPGETVILKVKRGFENHWERENVQEQATYKVQLIMLAINFGDGTGFINGGIPYPGGPSIEYKPHRYVKVPIDPN